MRKDLELIAQIDELLDGNISKNELMQSFGDVQDLDSQIKSQEALRKVFTKEAFLVNSKAILSKLKILTVVKIAVITFLCFGSSVIVFVFASQTAKVPSLTHPILIKAQGVVKTPISTNSNQKGANLNSAANNEEFKAITQIPPAAIRMARINESKLYALNNNSDPTEDTKSLQDSIYSFPQNQFSIVTMQNVGNVIRDVTSPTKKSEEINMIKGFLNTTQYKIRVNNQEHFHIDVLNGMGKSILNEKFVFLSRKTDAATRGENISISWSLQQGKTLIPGNYSARIFYMSKLISIKNFKVY